MVNEDGVKAMPDSGLLDIWENQHEYVAQMVSWVRAEIDRRGLDTNQLQVRTPDDIKKDLALESNVDFVRMVACLQGLAGAILFFISAAGLKDIATGQAGFLELVPALITLLVSIAILIFAVGVWKRWRWAIYLGLGWWALSTVLNAFALCESLFELSRNRSGERLTLLIAAAVGLVISFGLAAAFNSIRKSDLKQNRGRSTNAE